MTSPTTQTTEAHNVEEVQPVEPRRLRWLLWTTAGLLVLAGIGYGVWSLTGGEPVEPADQNSGPAATVEVTRETISDTRSFGGTLGHGEPFTVRANGQGIVTRVADPGTSTERGAELYRVDERPVVAFYGEIPMYRDLERGDTGADVSQLIDNLTALGYADCEAVDEFTACVEASVSTWQAELEVEERGVIAHGDIVFLPPGLQVDSIHVEPGDLISPAVPIMDLAGSDHVVSLEVNVRDRELLSVGTGVMTVLPGGIEVAGTVTASRVVPNAEAGADAGVGDTITRVEVTLSEPVEDALLGAPADVVIDIGERVDVLTVPVNALLALAEGGHGLEVVADDGTSSIVGVDTGLFAQGRVEVSGEGIEEGTVVGVAGR